MSSEFWDGRRVFVTGATGIVGSWLVKELLEKGANVIALIRDADPQSELYRSGDINKISVVNGSLEDFSTLKRAINEQEIETVFHLGAQTIVGAAYRDPFHTFEVNIRGTYNLLEACRLHPDLVKRVVVASSDKAYGDSEILPYTEDMPPLGKHPYDVSKSCTDLIAQSYYHTYKLPVAITRCGNIYGGGDLNWSRIVPGTIRAFLTGNRPIIRSDGTYVRDYIYVKDVVQAYMCLAECLDDVNVQGEAFNFSMESPLTVLELVKSIQKLMGCLDVELDIRNQVRAEIHSQYLAAEKARNLLLWKPKFSLETGLGEAIAWYKEFLTQN
ncbi:GDP-mannose 4,6-dehydratase [Aerosakkonemataceae cyanobacterium BLCC-F154]|uniref:GDP-mannose 4,6-dehydratase n=1 Tax=Floridaenema fluviatile BLCC-F154 TaxID=3153640 RepID=A0ABV4YCC9_9CYAN